MEWPFKHMQVGEILFIWDVPPAKASRAAHTYGAGMGKRFKTKTVHEPDGRIGLAVKRLKDRVYPAFDAQSKRDPRYVEHDFERMQRGSQWRFEGSNREIMRYMSAVHSRNRTNKEGKRWVVRTAKDPETKLYTHLMVVRIA